MTRSEVSPMTSQRKHTSRRTTAKTAAGPLTLEFDCWREAGPPGNPRAVLTGRGRLGGALLLAEAIEGVRNDVGSQQAVDSDYDKFLDCCWEAFSMDGRAEAVEIDGREYLVFIAPAC